MSICRFELKKLRSSRILCGLFVSLLVLNFIVALLSSRPSNDVGAVEKAYDDFLEDPQRVEQYYQELELLLIENIRNPEISLPYRYSSKYDDHVILSEVFERYDYICGYRENINRIIRLADRRMEDLSEYGFADDSYLVRSQVALRNRYESLTDEVPSDGNYAYGYDVYLHNRSGLIFIVIFLTVAISYLFLNDKQAKVDTVIRATRYGGLRTAVGKMLTCVTLCVVVTVVYCLTSFIAIGVSYGYSSPLAPVQSLPAFSTVPYSCSILGYLLLQTFFRIIAFTAYGMFLAMVASFRISHILNFVSGGLYSFANLYPYFRRYAGSLPAVKYLNLTSLADFTELTSFYRTVSVFGYPINYETAVLFIALGQLLTFSFLGCLFFCKAPSLSLRRNKILFKHVFTFKRISLAGAKPRKPLFARSLCYYELVKNRFGLALCLTGVLLLCRGFYVSNTVGSMENYEEALYYRYIEQIQPLDASSRRQFVLEERKRIDEIIGRNAEITNAFELGQISRSEYSEYLQIYYKAQQENSVFSNIERYCSYIDRKSDATGMDLKVIYTSGYEKYFSLSSDKFVCIALLLLCARVFSVEFSDSGGSGGFSQILRTTKNGRRRTYATKLATFMLIGAFISVCFKVFGYFVVKDNYLLPNMDSALCSLESFERVSSSITIRQYVILEFLIQILFGAFLSAVFCFVSLCVKRSIAYLCISSVLCTIPEVLYRTVFMKLPFLSILSLSVPQEFIQRGRYTDLTSYMFMVLLSFTLILLLLLFHGDRQFSREER